MAFYPCDLGGNELEEIKNSLYIVNDGTDEYKIKEMQIKEDIFPIFEPVSSYSYTSSTSQVSRGFMLECQGNLYMAYAVQGSSASQLFKSSGSSWSKATEQSISYKGGSVSAICSYLCGVTYNDIIYIHYWGAPETGYYGMKTYDPSTNQFTAVSVTGMTTDMYGGSMCVHNDLIYWANNKGVYTFDGTTLTRISDAPTYGAGASICVYKNEVHLLNGTYHYIYRNNAWNKLENPPTSNALFNTVCSNNNEIYYFDKSNNAYYIYDGTSWVLQENIANLTADYMFLCQLYATDTNVYRMYNTKNSTVSLIFDTLKTYKTNKLSDLKLKKSDSTEFICNNFAVGNLFGETGNVIEEGSANNYILGNNNIGKGNQMVLGHYNRQVDGGELSGTEGQALCIGNGTSSARANAFRVAYEGKVYAQNSTVSTGADYSEYFEWVDGNEDNEDRVGYFVTFDEKQKIRKANATDDYILGIVSGLPCIIGNGDECWRGRYILDEFGRFIEETFEYEETVINSETGEEETVTRIGTKYKENPEYNPNQPYEERAKRKEWSAIGMIGVLSVRDDGTCQENGYCTVADGGIATACKYGANAYRVLERVNDNIVKVLFK